MKQLATIALCLLSAVAALAQAPTVPSGPVSEPQPQYFLAAGAGFNHYTVPQASGWMTFGAKVGDGNYTYTTVTMTGKSSSMSVGYAKFHHLKPVTGLPFASSPLFASAAI